MSQEERTHWRSQEFSAWHRANSLNRFLQDRLRAEALSTIDLDGVLYTAFSDEQFPIALMELAVDYGQSFKQNKVTRILAEMAIIPGYVILYAVSKTEDNPCCPGVKDITGFRVMQIAPVLEKVFTSYTPAEYAFWEERMRAAALQSFMRTHPDIVKKYRKQK
jgi:hypothetical protein